jgi:hypothetical protein
MAQEKAGERAEQAIERARLEAASALRQVQRKNAAGLRALGLVRARGRPPGVPLVRPVERAHAEDRLRAHSAREIHITQCERQFYKRVVQRAQEQAGELPVTHLDRSSRKKPLKVDISNGLSTDISHQPKHATGATVLAALDSVQFPSNQSRKNVRDEEATRVDCFTVDVISARGGKGVLLSKNTEDRPQLTMLLARYMRAQDPGFKFTSIQVNKNVKSAMHVDANNLGPSRIIALGNFLGGELWAQNAKGGCDRLKVRDTWQTFVSASSPRGTSIMPPPRGGMSLVALPGLLQDGNLPHATTHFTGTRYSLIFFICASFRRLGCFTDQVTAQLQKAGGLGFDVAGLMVVCVRHPPPPPPPRPAPCPTSVF